MIYLLAVIFVFSVLVFFHELGHFLAAKLFGVRVERFSIGYPPRLFGIQIGETDYCISAIPFGGYVKLSGMVDESLDTEIKGEPWEFNSKPAWQKAIIISAGVMMNVILAIIILVGILYVKGEPVIPITTVGYVQDGSIAQKVGLQRFDKIVAINQQPVRTWNEIQQYYLANLGNDIVFSVDRQGELIQVVLSRENLGEEGSENLGISPLIPAVVGEIVPGYPAEKAGLQKGDRIIAINGQPIQDWLDMTEIVSQNPGKPLQFEVERNNTHLLLEITPKAVNEVGPDGESKIVGKIGISAITFVERRPLSFGQAVSKGLQQAQFTSAMMVKTLYWMVTGKKSAKEVIGGPIMIGKMAGDFAKTGFVNLLELLAYLSLMLAIINILPLPVLDGGHLVMIIIEGITGKPIPTKVKVAIQQVGMALMLMLILFVIYNDISRIFF